MASKGEVRLPNTSMSKQEKEQAASKKKAEQAVWLEKAAKMFQRSEDDAVVGRVLLGKLRHCTSNPDGGFGVGRVVLHDSAYAEICTDGLLREPPNRTVYCRASDCVRGYNAKEHDVVHFTLVHDHRGYRATEVRLAPLKPSESRRIGNVIAVHEDGGIIDSLGKRFHFRAASFPHGTQVSFDVADDMWSGRPLASNVQAMGAQVEVGVVGRIVKLNDQFGFIRTDSHAKDVYFHADQNLDGMELWDNVRFDIETDGNKSKAVRVLSADQTELHRKGSLKKPSGPAKKLVWRSDQKCLVEATAEVASLESRSEVKQPSCPAQAVKPPCPTRRPIKSGQLLVENKLQMVENKLQKDSAQEDASTVASSDDGTGPADARSSLLRLRSVMLQSGLNVDELDMKLQTLEIQGSLLRLRSDMLQNGLNVDELDVKLQTLESSTKAPVEDKQELDVKLQPLMSSTKAPVEDKQGFVPVVRKGRR